MAAQREAWPSARYRTITALFGAVVVLAVLATGIGSIVFEAAGLVENAGAGAAARDTVVRLFATAAFALLAFLPYYVALKMQKTWPRAVFFFAVAIFLVDVFQRFYAYVVSRSSTAGLIDLFLPLWLTAGLFVLWAVLAVFRLGSRGGGRGESAAGGNG